jgi:dynein heavy chain 2
MQGSALARMAVTDLRALVTRGMTQYEREEKTLDILLFAEIFDHIVRIDRVLSVEGGALLLVGRSGAWPHKTCVSIIFSRRIPPFASFVTSPLR